MDRQGRHAIFLESVIQLSNLLCTQYSRNIVTVCVQTVELCCLTVPTSVCISASISYLAQCTKRDKYDDYNDKLITRFTDI